jgi:hypothetical protein
MGPPMSNVRESSRLKQAERRARCVPRSDVGCVFFTAQKRLPTAATPSSQLSVSYVVCWPNCLLLHRCTVTRTAPQRQAVGP